MKNQVILFQFLFICSFVFGQNSLKSDLLYADQTAMEVKLNYSNKNVKKKGFLGKSPKA